MFGCVLVTKEVFLPELLAVALAAQSLRILAQCLSASEPRDDVIQFESLSCSAAAARRFKPKGFLFRRESVDAFLGSEAPLPRNAAIKPAKMLLPSLVLPRSN